MHFSNFRAEKQNPRSLKSRLCFWNLKFLKVSRNLNSIVRVRVHKHCAPKQKRAPCLALAYQPMAIKSPTKNLLVFRNSWTSTSRRSVGWQLRKKFVWQKSLYCYSEQTFFLNFFFNCHPTDLRLVEVQEFLILKDKKVFCRTFCSHRLIWPCSILRPGYYRISTYGDKKSDKKPFGLYL